MTAYYNEVDKGAAEWLRELIKGGHIAPGDVDERSIEDVCANELAGYTQCHFFAGIGVWSNALRLAGWPDDRPAWTGSCPCQPFSTAGKRKGTADERHLWPAFHWLIRQCRPDTVFGEQVASRDGRAWLDLVSTDLEGEGYAVGAVSSVACGFGAPHKRQRLYWVGRVADVHGERFTQLEERNSEPEQAQHTKSRHDLNGGVGAGGLVNPNNQRPQGRSQRRHGADKRPVGSAGVGSEGRGPTNGHWQDADWLGCRDGKWRPVEPGTFPLADRTPGRVGLLRGYGNAIVAQQAEAFVSAFVGVAQ